ncbi:MAG: hypothetical protein Q8O00_00485 [Holophaga sp.]|nr:hypothetical protein [Holophaga sp.]
MVPYAEPDNPQPVSNPVMRQDMVESSRSARLQWVPLRLACLDKTIAAMAEAGVVAILMEMAKQVGRKIFLILRLTKGGF